MKVAEIYEASEALYYWAGSLKGDFPDVAAELDKIARHLDQTAEAANRIDDDVEGPFPDVTALRLAAGNGSGLASEQWIW